MSAQPPIVTGPDGLPHCGWCTDGALCGPHRKSVNSALDTLRSAHLLARAERDIRYVINHKDKYAEQDA